MSFDCRQSANALTVAPHLGSPKIDLEEMQMCKPFARNTS